MIYKITPVPEPRMTRSDRWKLRPCVLRYRAFCDQVRAASVTIMPGDHIIFFLPMPKSWSAKKKNTMDGMPHTSKPDADNLAKALCDAYHTDDSGIWDFRVTKLWRQEGWIEVRRMAPMDVPYVSKNMGGGVKMEPNFKEVSKCQNLSRSPK